MMWSLLVFLTLSMNDRRGVQVVGSKSRTWIIQEVDSAGHVQTKESDWSKKSRAQSLVNWYSPLSLAVYLVIHCGSSASRCGPGHHQFNVTQQFPLFSHCGHNYYYLAAPFDCTENRTSCRHRRTIWQFKFPGIQHTNQRNQYSKLLFTANRWCILQKRENLKLYMVFYLHIQAKQVEETIWRKVQRLDCNNQRGKCWFIWGKGGESTGRSQLSENPNWWGSILLLLSTKVGQR